MVGSCSDGGSGSQYMHMEMMPGCSLKAVIWRGSKLGSRGSEVFDRAVKPRVVASGAKQLSSQAACALQVSNGQLTDQALQWQPSGACDVGPGAKCRNSWHSMNWP